MASPSIGFPLTFILLLSGLVVLRTTIQRAEAVCTLACVQGTFITCRNRPGQQLYGCACRCAPPGGKHCVVHLADNSTLPC